jgi:hypothetical protein
MLGSDAKAEDGASLRPVILSDMAETNAALAQWRMLLRAKMGRLG